MLREEAGNEAVITMHQMMSAMAEFGTTNSAESEELVRTAARGELIKLRDLLLVKFPVDNTNDSANENAMDVTQDDDTGSGICQKRNDRATEKLRRIEHCKAEDCIA